jgi:hypothetical protein
MILKDKIDSLEEDELAILMYVLSENSGPDFTWHKEYLTALKEKELFNILNAWAPKIKEHKRQSMQNIVNKLIG